VSCHSTKGNSGNDSVFIYIPQSLPQGDKRFPKLFPNLWTVGYICM
jgi:hypothetical protein